MVHHNVEPLITLCDGNLQDHRELQHILTPCTNLFLHGHTHEGRLGWMDNVCPILGTGSASLKSAKRPDEIPNQYQIIQVSEGLLRVFKRCYFPEQMQWGADVRVGNDGLIEKMVQFDSVHCTFSPIKETHVTNFLETYLVRLRHLPVLPGLINLSNRNSFQEGHVIRVSVFSQEVFGNNFVSMRQIGSSLTIRNLLHDVLSGSTKVVMLLGVAGITTIRL